MLALEGIFGGSEGRNGPSTDVLHLHSAALSTWSLLLTVLPAQHIYKLSQMYLYWFISYTGTWFIHHFVYLSCFSHVGGLVQLLDSTDVDVRIGAGEAIALIYEGARQYDEDFGFADSGSGDDERSDGGAASPSLDQVDDLCLKLRQLATDSNKYRAKKDRKQQRSSFRDILRAIEVKTCDYFLSFRCFEQKKM